MFKQKSDPQAASIEPADAVQQARTRARQRLIGAIVLLGIGIIGFPLVFETQPRPIPVDIPIEIPKKDALPPLVAPAPRPAVTGAPADVPAREQTLVDSHGDAGRDVAAKPRAAASGTEAAASRAAPGNVAAAPATAAASQAAVPAAAPERHAAVPAPTPAAPPPESKRDEGERARALLEGRPVAAAEAQRFIVQVGAFADAEAARETRQKVEKLGLKTYTQVAQTTSGSRIRVRVGPFASRGDAEAALAKAKAAGLDAVVLTL
ncbi:MAG TPA: SPOR domain-containing protein [Caldimonas sp.]|nr:SPOR domain-containing protein [Caldimonas sp.]